MNFGVSMGAIFEPRVLAELAALAEASGWDGVFLEDYLVYQGHVGTPTFDPWVALAAMVVATRQIRLGTMVTPLPRRRPWKLASEAVTVDHLSEGRLILGVGAGDTQDPSFAAAGEPTEPRVLAERLDEGLEILAGLWSGEPITFAGKHYRVDGLGLAPTPVQRPRIPLWVGGDWLVGAVRRRLVRWDGCCVYQGRPGTDASGPLTAAQVRELVALVERERGTREGFDVCVGGWERGSDWELERAKIRSIADAGATWWQEWTTGDLEHVREAVGRGPLRID